MSNNLERYGVFALIFVLLLIVSISLWGGDEERGLRADNRDTPSEARLLVGTGEPVGEEIEKPMVLPEGPADPPAVPRPRGPVFGEYVVKPNDNPSKIAQAVYGSARYVQDILAANPGLDPRRMHSGDKIRLPDLRDKLRSEREARNPGPRGPSPVAAAPPAASRTHTVARGESLEVIARRYYGTRARIGDILRLNPEIRDPNFIREGTTIRLP